MPEGVVEELFIANVPATGVKEVWFRNWSVTANLGLRAAGTLAENPESVVWGETSGHDRFVVRTGTTPGTQKYYIFSIIRTGNDVVFGTGVIPTATLVRTENPALSTGIQVVKLSIESFVHKETRSMFGSVHTSVDSNSAGATWHVESLEGRLTATSTTTSAIGTQTLTLADILATVGVVTYGLNTSNQ